MKNIFKIHPSFYIYSILLILSGYINYFIIMVLVFLIHELGHIFSIKLLGYKINEITIYPCGGIIKTNLKLNSKSLHIFIISISGIIFQVVSLLFIKKYNYNSEIFYQINYYIILINLLPIYPLDGNKLLLSILETLFSYKFIVKKITYLSYIFLIILLIYTKNIFIVTILLYSNILFIKNMEYYYNKFKLERLLYGPYNYKNKNIKDINHLYKCKNNIIDGKSELEYLKYVEFH